MSVLAADQLRFRRFLDLNQYPASSGQLGSLINHIPYRVTNVPQSSNLTPPLSPVLLAGFALRPIPPILFQPVLDAAMAIIGRRHPGIVDRISAFGQPTYLIDPVDLPYVFIFRPDPRAPRIIVEYSGHSCDVDAAIRGPLACLLAMLEGRTDGDALFFSRDLVIEGDTEAVVALRNAIDDAEIDLKDDLLSLFGPFSAPLTTLVDLAERVAGLAAQDLETLRRAIISPSMRRHESQDAMLDELSSRVSVSPGKNRNAKERKTRSPRP